MFNALGYLSLRTKNVLSHVNTVREFGLESITKITLMGIRFQYDDGHFQSCWQLMIIWVHVPRIIWVTNPYHLHGSCRICRQRCDWQLHVRPLDPNRSNPSDITMHASMPWLDGVVVSPVLAAVVAVRKLVTEENKPKLFHSAGMTSNGK